MTFEDYVQENNLNCYLDEDAMYAVEKAWSHQKEKIDAILKILDKGMCIGDRFMIDVDEIQEILK